MVELAVGLFDDDLDRRQNAGRELVGDDRVPAPGRRVGHRRRAQGETEVHAEGGNGGGE